MNKTIIDDAIKKSYEVTGQFQLDYIIFLVYGKVLDAKHFRHSLPNSKKEELLSYNKDLRFLDTEEDHIYCKDISDIPTVNNIIDNHPNCIGYLIDTYPIAFMDDCVLSFEGEYHETLIVHYKEGFNYLPLFKYAIIRTSEEDPMIKYYDGKRFYKNKIKKIINSEILDNYNDDIPNKDIFNFINDESIGGLCLLHGIPGTGKSYYIRSLINEFIHKDFIYCEGHNLNDLLSGDMIDLVSGSIIILEDCEDLIKDRNNSVFSNHISKMLNVADGIIGDCMNVKIICTFNTKFTNIDKALIRKGRVKINYEFKPLTKDKANNLRKKLNKNPGESAVLCDILNEDSCGVNNTNINNKKIGF